MNDITASKYLLTEKKGFIARNQSSVRKVLKSLTFWKDVLLIIQDIYDLANEKIPQDEKEEIVQKNIELVKYLLRKENISEFMVDMVAAGVQVALKHVGIKLSKTIRV